VKTTLSVPPIQYANSDNLSFICIWDTVLNFMLDCKKKIQIKCHFSQINEADDIRDNKKSFLQDGLPYGVICCNNIRLYDLQQSCLQFSGGIIHRELVLR
jgi:hypothetical protein